MDYFTYNPEENNVAPDSLETALFAAVYRGDAPAVEMLLEQGANANAKKLMPILSVGEPASEFPVKSHVSISILMLAADRGNPAIVASLLKRGAMVNELVPLLETSNPKVHAVNALSPLACALTKEHWPCLQLLCAQALPVNKAQAFHFVLANKANLGFQDLPLFIANSLLVGFDINGKNILGQTPLEVAIGGKRPAEWSMLVLILITLGADANIANEGQQTPLHVATMYAEPGLMKMLVEHGHADVNACTSRGISPLHLLASAPGKKVVLPNGYTIPIMKMSIQLEMVNYLLSRQAIIDITEQEGMTPLMVAAGLHKHEMVHLLIKQGANITLQNKEGLTALEKYVTQSAVCDEKTLKFFVHQAEAVAPWMVPKAICRVAKRLKEERDTASRLNLDMLVAEVCPSAVLSSLQLMVYYLVQIGQLDVLYQLLAQCKEPSFAQRIIAAAHAFKAVSTAGFDEPRLLTALILGQQDWATVLANIACADIIASKPGSIALMCMAQDVLIEEWRRMTKETAIRDATSSVVDWLLNHECVKPHSPSR